MLSLLSSRYFSDSDSLFVWTCCCSAVSLRVLLVCIVLYVLVVCPRHGRLKMSPDLGGIYLNASFIFLFGYGLSCYETSWHVTSMYVPGL